MAKVKKAAVKAQLGKTKTQTKVRKRSMGAVTAKPKGSPPRTAAKPKPAQSIAAKLGHAVDVVVETIKDTAEMRRKMHADQPEE